MFESSSGVGLGLTQDSAKDIVSADEETWALAFFSIQSHCTRLHHPVLSTACVVKFCLDSVWILTAKEAQRLLS